MTMIRRLFCNVGTVDIDKITITTNGEIVDSITTEHQFNKGDYVKINNNGELTCCSEEESIGMLIENMQYSKDIITNDIYFYAYVQLFGKEIITLPKNIGQTKTLNGQKYIKIKDNEYLVSGNNKNKGECIK